MVTLKDIHTILLKIDNLNLLNFIDKTPIINNLNKILPNNEKVEHINFSIRNNKDTFFLCTCNDKNEYSHYSYYPITSAWKVFTNEMYNVVYNELLSFYNNSLQFIHNFTNTDDDIKRMEMCLDYLIKPYMQRFNGDRYKVKPCITKGKRAFEKDEYTIIKIGQGNDYIGGININDNKFKYFTPMCGECSFNFKDDEIVYNIYTAINFICR